MENTGIIKDVVLTTSLKGNTQLLATICTSKESSTPYTTDILGIINLEKNIDDYSKEEIEAIKEKFESKTFEIINDSLFESLFSFIRKNM